MMIGPSLQLPGIYLSAGVKERERGGEYKGNYTIKQWIYAVLSETIGMELNAKAK